MTSAEAQDRFLDLNGLRFHVREWGDAASPPLILLHGAWWHARVWDTFAAAMCDRFRVLALDQRGHGDTEWAEDYSWPRWLEDLAAFVDAMGLRRFSLLGHSMGGWVSYMFAGAHPGLIERLVIVDFGPEQRTPTLAQIQALTAMLTDQVWEDPKQAIAAIREAAPLADESELGRAVLHNLRPRPEGGWGWRYDTRRRSTGRRDRVPNEESQWAALQAIRCPVLIMRGGHGILTRETAQRMLDRMADARLVEAPDGGHNPHLETPGLFLSEVRRFLVGSEDAADNARAS